MLLAKLNLSLECLTGSLDTKVVEDHRLSQDDAHVSMCLLAGMIPFCLFAGEQSNVPVQIENPIHCFASLVLGIQEARPQEHELV